MTLEGPVVTDQGREAGVLAYPPLVLPVAVCGPGYVWLASLLDRVRFRLLPIGAFALRLERLGGC